MAVAKIREFTGLGEPGSLRCKRRVAVGAVEMTRRAASRGQLQAGGRLADSGPGVSRYFSAGRGCCRYSKKPAAVTDGTGLWQGRTCDHAGMKGRSISRPWSRASRILRRLMVGPVRWA